MAVDGVVYFRVSDPIKSVANVSNADFATRLLAQTTLRNMLGTKNLSEVLSDREAIAHGMQVHAAVPPPSSPLSAIYGRPFTETQRALSEHFSVA